MPFGLLDPKDFYIIWLSNLLIISVPVEGYSNLMIISVQSVEGYSRNVSCALNLISTFVIIGTCMVIQRYIVALLFCFFTHGVSGYEYEIK